MNDELTYRCMTCGFSAKRPEFNRKHPHCMLAERVKWLACIAVAMVLMVLLTGCMGFAEGVQAVRISKGEGSALGKFIGLGGEYCQITATTGVTITEEDREAARKYCAPDAERLVELLRRTPDL